MPNVVTHIHPELFVEVFVGISGFCLIHKYNRGINDNIFKFWGKRYIQIMPLFWITVSIMIIFDYVVNGIAWISSPYPISFFKQYVGLSAGLFSLEGHANGALWTIDLLLICYIFFWLYIKLRNWNRWGKLLSDALLAIILLISLYGMVHWWNKPFLYYVMSLRVYASFIVGIIVYNVLQMKERVYRLLYLFGGALYILC